MSFGWSVGDCVQGGKLVYKVVNVVVDAEKAPDEVQVAQQRSDAIQGSLGHVTTSFTTGQSINNNTEIDDLVHQIAATEKKHSLKRHKRYGEKFGQGVAKRRLRAVPEKILWTVHGKKDDDRHQRDQQGALDALQMHMLASIADRQHDHVATTEKLQAEGDAHRNAVIRKATEIGTEMLQKMEETGGSVQQQQMVLAGNIEKKLDDISALIQHQTGAQRSIEEHLQRYLQGLEPLMNKVDENLTSQRPSLSAEKSPSYRRSEPDTRRTRSVQARQVVMSPSAIPAARERIESISVFRIYKRSVELTRHSSSNDSSKTVRTASMYEGGDYLTLLLLILAVCCELGLEMGRYISQASRRRSIPAPVSYFLSDNIYFTDALGREFRLPLDQTRTWRMLQQWLREQFKDCPGSSKVQSGQFFIFDPRDPDRIVSATTWHTAVGPRRRFQMGVIYSQTQLDEYCPKCFLGKKRKTLTKGRGEFNVLCPSCGALYSSASLGSIRPTLSFLATSLFVDDEMGPGRRRLPYSTALAVAPLGMRYLAEEFANLISASGSEDLMMALDLDLDLDLNMRGPRARPRWDEEKGRSTIAYSRWKQEEHSEEPQEVPAVYGPSPDMGQEGEQEQKDLEHIKTVWIRRDARLHDAALGRDCSLARELILKGHDPNQRAGRAGSPLIAAIVSGSHEIVQMLLDNGADPLLSVQQGHNPVSVAACHATDRVGHVLFPAAFHASYDRPAEFQKAVDRALYESTTKQHEWHDFLLFIGANPVAPCPGLRETAFAKAMAAKDVALLNRFIMVLWERRLLTRFEAIILATTVKGDDVHPGKTLEPWLRVCRVALAAGDSRVVVQEINKRIREKPEFYFRLNIGNTTCHPDMQRFWRSCENERKGIVVPPELAGMGV